jgi:Tol biopolymer transport system component
VALPAPVNTRESELCPTVSPDGRYLFFIRNGRVYWVDAAIIDAQRAGPSR